jgi:MFS family permease
MPLTAALSDIFGRRELLVVSLILFTLGSLIACTSKDIAQLLAGRSVQGVGGGGIIVVSNVIFTDIVPLRQRPKFTAPIIVFAAVGAILGPLVGGVFSTPTTWRWIFYLNFPFCAIGLTTIPWVVRLQMKHATPLRGKLLRIDWLGSALFIVGMTTFLAALTWGGVLYPWSDFQTVVPLVVGSAVVAGSIIWARWGSADPFIRVQVLEDRTAAAAYLSSIIQGILVSKSVEVDKNYLNSWHR